MIIFSLLLLMSPLFCENSSIQDIEQQVFVKVCEDKGPIYFDQESLDDIRRSIFLSIDMDTYNQFKIKEMSLIHTLEGFILYGNEQKFETQTVVGQFTKTYLKSLPIKPSFTRTRKVFLTETITSYVLDPEKFQLPKDTNLTITITENEHKIVMSPAMKTLITQMDELHDREIARFEKIAHDKKNKCLRFLDEHDKLVCLLAATITAIGICGAIYFDKLLKIG
jgi:hypothetical protein